MLNRMLCEGMRTTRCKSPCRMASSILGNSTADGRVPSGNGCWSSNSDSIFSKCDLPEPKKPEIHTPLALVSFK